jgi:hypothetical protein
VADGAAITAVAVPEPASATLLVLGGLLGLFVPAIRARKKTKGTFLFFGGKGRVKAVRGE